MALLHREIIMLWQRSLLCSGIKMESLKGGNSATDYTEEGIHVPPFLIIVQELANIIMSLVVVLITFYEYF
jgi:hypothetical protein